jgi:DNA invertase Pin-like site-specific DNA recombinase
MPEKWFHCSGAWNSLAPNGDPTRAFRFELEKIVFCLLPGFRRIGKGRSGLGLEALQSAVRNYLNGGDWELIGEFTEIESGKHADRPELMKALDRCRRQKARLVIAKLDRLSRNLAFIATLMDSGVEFVAVDNPHANKLTVHILAAVAQHEREMISERTRSALQAAKARGKKLGSPKVREAVVLGNAVIQDNAARFAANVLPVIREIQAFGTRSNAAIAAKLNERRVPTARGGVWTHVQVRAVIGRASAQAPA